jgi:hypothetical protein
VGQNARKTVAEHITWERVGEEWLRQARELV